MTSTKYPDNMSCFDILSIFDILSLLAHYLALPKLLRERQVEMSVEDRREREKQARRDTILNAAETLFFQEGYDRCSMDKIAQAAQLSRALLYVYFKDKAAIMRGIMLRSAKAIQQRFVEAIASSSVGAEQIENIGFTYYRFSVEQPNYFDALGQASGFIEQDESDEQSQELKQCNHETMLLMVKALRQGISDGSLSATRVSDPFKTAYYLRGALHGVMMQCRILPQANADFPDPEDLVKYTLGMLTQSMRP